MEKETKVEAAGIGAGAEKEAMKEAELANVHGGVLSPFVGTVSLSSSLSAIKLTALRNSVRLIAVHL